MNDVRMSLKSYQQGEAVLDSSHWGCASPERTHGSHENLDHLQKTRLFPIV